MRYYLLYNTILILLFPLVFTWYLFQALIRKKYRRGLTERFGGVPDAIQSACAGQQPLWVHCSSVGEVLAAGPVIDAIENYWPDLPIVMSTVTDTGYAIARTRLPGLKGCFHLPFDIPLFVSRTFESVRPRALIILETEIWPNLIRTASRNRVPIMVVNGRISEKSRNRYLKFKPFIGDVLSQISVFAMQSERDAGRIVSMGADIHRVHVTGNVKYDQAPVSPDDTLPLEPPWEGPVFVLAAGSTHSGEETILLDVFKSLKPRIPELRMILAPRHLDRLPEIERLLKQKELSYRLWTESRTDSLPADIGIVLVDTMGELLTVYRMSDLTFVGGSLVPVGGHNILEPAGFARPVIVGPHMHNFTEISGQMRENDALITVKDSRELTAAIRDLHARPEQRKRQGENGYRVVQMNRGAVEKTLEYFEKVVTGDYITTASAQGKIDFEPGSLGRAGEWLAGVYGLVTGMRNRMFDTGIRDEHRASAPVICIGNLTAGGTGKTPMVITVVRILLETDLSPAVVSRGYRARFGKVPVKVHPFGHFRDWGDEPLLLARTLPDTPVVISRDRYRGCKWATGEFSPDVFVLDDGFQHRSLARDLNILLLDARHPITAEKLLPAGRLREPLTAMKRADIIVFSHSDRVEPHAADLTAIKKYAPDTPVYHGRHKFAGFRLAGTTEIFEAKRVRAGMLCAIADPAGFRHSLIENDVEILFECVYPDHHPLTPQHWKDAAEKLAATDADYLIITAKDEMRITGDEIAGMPVLILDVVFDVAEMDAFKSHVLGVSGG